MSLTELIKNPKFRAGDKVQIVREIPKVDGVIQFETANLKEGTFGEITDFIDLTEDNEYLYELAGKEGIKVPESVLEKRKIYTRMEYSEDILSRLSSLMEQGKKYFQDIMEQNRDIKVIEEHLFIWTVMNLNLMKTLGNTAMLPVMEKELKNLELIIANMMNGSPME